MKINISAIKNTAIGAAKKTGFKVAKHSPELLVGFGIVGVVAAGVMACVATAKTVKADGIIDELHKKREQIEEVKKASDTDNLPEDTAYTLEDYKNDLKTVYIQTGVKLAKTYAPAIILGVVSIAAITKGHMILKKRNVALAAAYATLNESFKDYRKRVVNKFGADLDKELKFGTTAEKIQVKEIDPETGKEVTKKEIVSVAGDDILHSPYAKFFDSSSRYWEKNADYNLMTLRAVQNHMNDLLTRDGYVYLNQVYEALDIPRTKEGQVIGWMKDGKDKNGKVVGDGFIDFGIYNVNRPANRDFVNGYEPVILLDFNVDGYIWDRM